MKSIKMLVDDIYGLFSGGYLFPKEDVQSFGKALSERISVRISEERERSRLRLSNIGSPCRRQLWYRVNQSDLSEPLHPATRIKFLFGDILEELLLFLAKAAGHTVEREQEEVSISGVKGHIDATIDGELVDCKSTSTYSFAKFADHALDSDDPFGYIDQLGSYAFALDKDQGHFLAIDKTLGKICLDTYPVPDIDYKKKITELQEVLAQTEPPPRAFTDEKSGESGNRKLGLNCGYCDFKKTCWPELRTFFYAGSHGSSKPVHLTVVRRVPNVPELT